MEEILEGKVIPASLETYSLVSCTYETVKEESTTVLVYVIDKLYLQERRIHCKLKWSRRSCWNNWELYEAKTHSFEALEIMNIWELFQFTGSIFGMQIIKQFEKKYFFQASIGLSRLYANSKLFFLIFQNSFLKTSQIWFI